MELFLTSNIGGYKKIDGKKVACAIDDSNGIITLLKSAMQYSDALKNVGKIVWVASDPDNYDATDEHSQLIFKALELSGITFGQYAILDNRVVKENKVDEVLNNANLVILSGGDTLKQNEFINRIGLEEKIRTLVCKDAVIVGISAGSINCAENVYNSPECAEDLDKPCYLKGLGFTKINIEPHFDINDVSEEGSIQRNAILEESYNRDIYALEDGAYIVDYFQFSIIHGNAYRISNGEINKICNTGEKRSMSNVIGEVYYKLLEDSFFYKPLFINNANDMGYGTNSAFKLAVEYCMDKFKFKKPGEAERYIRENAKKFYEHIIEFVKGKNYTFESIIELERQYNLSYKELFKLLENILSEEEYNVLLVNKQKYEYSKTFPDKPLDDSTNIKGSLEEFTFNLAKGIRFDYILLCDELESYGLSGINMYEYVIDFINKTNTLTPREKESALEELKSSLATSKTIFYSGGYELKNKQFYDELINVNTIEEIDNLVKKYDVKVVGFDFSKSIDSYSLKHHRANKNEVIDNLSQKIREYKKYLREKRYAEEKLQRELDLLFEAQQLIVGYIISNEESIKIYCEKNGISQYTFDKMSDIIKKHDPDLYEELRSLIDSQVKARFVAILSNIQKVIDGLKHGVAELSGVRRFDIIDYLEITRISPQALLGIARGRFPDSDVKLLTSFVRVHTGLRSLSQSQINSFLMNTIMINQKKDAKGAIIPESGKEVPFEVKQRAIDFLMNHSYTINTRTLYAAIRREMQHQIKK